MRISEAYEHEPILAYQGEETAVQGSCSRIGTQCVDVSAPLTLMPAATIGTPTVTYQGTPAITCVTNPEGTSCTVTMTQQICVSVPIRYGVTMAGGEPRISCADSCAGCGCC